ncbi:MAG: G5 domain-containing protein [Clostridia bacterium]|nr:G5 domain-containing protein [Clostridia bacterium]
MNAKSKKLSSFLKNFFKKRTRIAITVIIAILCAATLMTTVSALNTVKIIHNGKEYEISTLRTNAEEIVRKSGIDFDEKESHIDTSLFEEQGIIYVNDICTVTFIDEDESVTVKSHGTVGDALKDAKIELGENDELEGAKTDDYLSQGLVVKIKRAVSVMIKADGDITNVYVTKGSTVEDALNKAVITADDDDIISKPLDKVIESNTTIKITRVSIVERTEKQTVEFKTKKEYDKNLAKGKTKIKKEGVDGQQEATYEDKFVDGELVESNLKSTKIIKAPVDCIKIVGTKSSVVSANAKASGSKGAATTSGGAKTASGVKTISVFTPPSSLKLTKNNVPTSYRKKISGSATAYYGGTITATGASVKPGIVAVNPRQIPYHTAMWIVSNDGKFVYGYSFAEDTGGFINFTGARTTLCDLYMPSLSACYAFGRRDVTIYIL